VPFPDPSTARITPGSHWPMPSPNLHLGPDGMTPERPTGYVSGVWPELPASLYRASTLFPSGSSK
jgi:hypothetical protein